MVFCRSDITAKFAKAALDTAILASLAQSTFQSCLMLGCEARFERGVWHAKPAN
jgi:hypothetical protein